MNNESEPKFLSPTFLILYMVLAVGVIMLLHFKCPQSQLDKLASIIVLIISAGAVIKYADYTRRMLAIQNWAYVDSKNPVISFVLDQVVGGDLKTYVKLRNHSNFDTSVWIDLNLKVKGDIVRVGAPYYTGETPWNLQAQQTIEGAHFIPAPDILNQKSITISELENQWKSIKLKNKEVNSIITVSVNIRYRGAMDKILTKPTLNWYYDFSNGKWIYQV